MKLATTTCGNIVCHLKSIFARHGIPEEVISDNGPQYIGEPFIKFSKEYGFVHTTSSPKHRQGNGEAERGVKTVKSLLEKSTDPYLALLSYRSTPLRNGYSPAELLMGRQLRTNVPLVLDKLKPSVPDLKELKRRKKTDVSLPNFMYPNNLRLRRKKDVSQVQILN